MDNLTFKDKLKKKKGYSIENRVYDGCPHWTTGKKFLDDEFTL